MMFRNCFQILRTVTSQGSKFLFKIVQDPPRIDHVRGYKKESKKLPNILVNKYMEFIMHNTTEGPNLVRAHKTVQDRSYCNTLCRINPPIIDVARRLEVGRKELTKLQEHACVPCPVNLPNYAPELVRPKVKYNEMKCKDANCVTYSQARIPRMDGILGLKVTVKKLPKIPEPGKTSVNYVPKYAPEIKREKCWRLCKDKCDHDPQRMADVLCWKPMKKQQQPSFINFNQTRRYSTLPGNRISNAIYSHKHYANLSENAYMYGRRYLNNQRPGDPRFKFKPTPNWSKNCRKFKFKLKKIRSLWQKICSYFRARPNCPGPHEWKQKDLEMKARRAAAAAALQIYDPKPKYVKFDQKCKEKLPGAKPKKNKKKTKYIIHLPKKEKSY